MTTATREAAMASPDLERLLARSAELGEQMQTLAEQLNTTAKELLDLAATRQQADEDVAEEARKVGRDDDS